MSARVIAFHATSSRSLGIRERTRQPAEQAIASRSTGTDISLGNKLQVLAITNPFLMRAVERLVDRLLREQRHGHNIDGEGA